jgi:hypothetical protein
MLTLSLGARRARCAVGSLEVQRIDTSSSRCRPRNAYAGSPAAGEKQSAPQTSSRLPDTQPAAPQRAHLVPWKSSPAKTTQARAYRWNPLADPWSHDLIAGPTAPPTQPTHLPKTSPAADTASARGGSPCAAVAAALGHNDVVPQAAASGWAQKGCGGRLPRGRGLRAESEEGETAAQWRKLPGGRYRMREPGR